MRSIGNNLRSNLVCPAFEYLLLARGRDRLETKTCRSTCFHRYRSSYLLGDAIDWKRPYGLEVDDIFFDLLLARGCDQLEKPANETTSMDAASLLLARGRDQLETEIR